MKGCPQEPPKNSPVDTSGEVVLHADEAQIKGTETRIIGQGCRS